MNRLKASGIAEPELNARWLIKYSLPESLEENIERRLKHEPLAKILRSKGFYKYDFVTTADTLDPRDDSETLLMLAFSKFTDKNANIKVADICSGTGCLGLSFISEYPHSELTLIDISEKAMHVAAENSKNLYLSDRCTFFTGDMCDFSGKNFDLIFFNPPYLRTSELEYLDDDTKYDPVIALDGGADGLSFYRRFDPKILAEKGIIIAEIGINQKKDVEDIFKEKKMFLAESRKDIGGIERALCFMRDSGII